MVYQVRMIENKQLILVTQDIGDFLSAWCRYGNLSCLDDVCEASRLCSTRCKIAMKVVANCLNDFFTSVFTNEPVSDVPTLPDRSNGSILQDIEITHQDILYQPGQLKTNKSCGSDNCHPLALKNVKEGLVVPLYYLYCKSLEEASLP